jgi:hypothetical protein
MKSHSTRSGLTLVEVLIALAITLIILLRMTQAFTIASKEMGIGRNRLMVSERVQTAADLIRDDLERLSLRTGPVVSAAAGVGYLEIVDGPYRDLTFLDTPNAVIGTPSNLLGDIDDILMFTAVSPGRPFKGRFDGRMIDSHEAEIIYFTRRVDSNGNGVVDFGDQIRLHRRVLLVRPDLAAEIQDPNIGSNVVARSAAQFDTFVTNNGLDPTMMVRTPYAKFLQFNDVSLAWNPDSGPVGPMGPLFNQYRANSLGLLSHPQNRTAHLATLLPPAVAFPHPVANLGLPADRLINTYLDDLVLVGTMAGSDVVMENVIAFDVKVFDPTVPVLQYAGQPLLPHDPGYALAYTDVANFPRQGFGAYVDLGSFEFRSINGVPGLANDFGPQFPGQWYHFANWRRRLVDPQYVAFVAEQPAANYWDAIMTRYENVAGGPTYSTWTTDFESDGVDNDGDLLVDEGADGVPQANAVPGLRNDRDSAPPYLQPVTSLQVSVRGASINADRQQVRGSDQVMQAQIVVSTTNQ